MAINKYLPTKNEPQNEALVQAKVPWKLRERAHAILKERHLTWNDLVVASLVELCDEEDRRAGIQSDSQRPSTHATKPKGAQPNPSRKQNSQP